MNRWLAPRCLGSGVPGDLFEWGHTVVPGTEQQLFVGWTETWRSSYFSKRARRCRRCASTRYYWRRENLEPKASATIKDHAHSMVKAGFAASYDEAKQIMAYNGVDKVAVAAIFRDAIGKACPGLCCIVRRNTAGKVVLEPHIITEYSDLHFDWRDPRFPLSRENCGPLCHTCNGQKRRTPWVEFIARQRAIRMNLEQATAFGPPPVQGTLFDDVA